MDNHSDLNSSPTIEFGLYVDKLPSEIYDSYMDMTTGAGLGIVNLFADTQTDAISYVTFRKLIKKENFASTLKPLDTRYTTMLDRLRDFRNWAAHVPQSLINAEMVSAEKIDRDAKSKLLQPRTEIKVPIYEAHGTEILVELYRDCYLSLKRFRELYLRVCEDYTQLIGKAIKVDYAVFENREYKPESIQDISYSMQRNKFKPM
ncbi:hypothetical protein [Paenibacillus sp. FSL M7-1046]|uniref:hypothetical protein n=1 Tax=Paenibacillus sp. FSL M7-1046 TaxID=2975315 RepID=UPI0030F794D5